LTVNTNFYTSIFNAVPRFKHYYVLFEGEATGAGAPKAGKLPDGLLLMKASEEKVELVAKFAEVEARLKDAEAACRLHSLHRLRR